MITLSHVSKYYHLGEETIKAMDDISLQVADREFVALVGDSGSGKSTLMHAIGCLDMPDTGQFLLGGRDVTHCSDNELAAMRSGKIGFVFQQFYLLPQMTAFENVELPLIYQKTGGRERRKRVLEALTRVGLQNRLYHRPDQLSGGQQQRVAIARALVTRPSLILADEPTGNLDSKSGDEIMDLICELHRQGNTVLLITHSPRLAARAQRRLHIEDGRIVRDERGRGKGGVSI